MNTKIIFLLLLLCVSGLVNAKTVYVTDNLSFTVKTDDSKDSLILTTINSGTPLTLLSKKRSSEYAKVRLADGQIGFILNSYLTTEPASKSYLEKANAELIKLRQQNLQFQSELVRIKQGGTTAITLDLTRERDKLAAELAGLRETTADAVNVKKQRDQLQEDFIKATKELEQLKLEKKTLETNANQDWFIYGGLLSLFGVILGFLLPKLSTRKRMHSWDSF